MQVYIMSEIIKNLRAQDIGIMFGQQSASSAKYTYSDIINNAEVEDDLLDIMSMYWKHDRILMISMFPKLNQMVVREGWGSGFLDTIFPLRHLV